MEKAVISGRFQTEALETKALSVVELGCGATCSRLVQYRILVSKGAIYRKGNKNGAKEDRTKG